MHPEDAGGDRDEMPDDRYQSSKEGIELIVRKEELLRAVIIFLMDEDIFPVSEKEWLSDELSEYKIIHKRPDETPEGSGQDHQREIELSGGHQVSGRNHDRFRRHREYA